MSAPAGRTLTRYLLTRPDGAYWAANGAWVTAAAKARHFETADAAYRVRDYVISPADRSVMRDSRHRSLTEVQVTDPSPDPVRRDDTALWRMGDDSRD